MKLAPTFRPSLAPARAAGFLLAALLLLFASGCPSTGVLDDDDTGANDDDNSTTPADCSDLLVPALEWFDSPATGTLEGQVEFGQTHVIASDETRWAPPVVAEREALLLFTPAEALDPGEDLRVGAFEGGQILGVLRLAPPSALPRSLEQDLTEVALDPYSAAAWSASLPWRWMRAGVELGIGHLSADGVAVNSQPLTDLGAPHTFTLSRSKIVLFGEPDFDTTTASPTKLAQDFFSTLPFAELRFVDSAPWRLAELVIPTALGPRLVSSEDERLALSNESDRWSILKHQFALRMSLANTGRGLVLTVPSEGDNSPYSFGTSLGLGWVRRGDGSYVDINDSPYAAGWTGWSALWQGECANVFNHELGHSMTLLHFNNGAAANWGIDDEYPDDGTNLEGHPWGFDTTRRQFRTWYRVDSGGPVSDEDGLIGKRDAMNGGESANGITCFPQYTAYHSWKAQDWAESSPTLAVIDGEPGVWRWNANSQAYESEAVGAAHQEPIAIGVPVLTLTGTLGNDDTACQTYPPNFWPSGNAFVLPDPTDPSLPSSFDGARWFLEIGYGDGSSERALIARGAMDETNALALYSLNIEASRQPIGVDLYRADAAYPNLDPAASQLIHSREIELPSEPVGAVVRVGRGFVANGDLLLDQRCSPGVDCSVRRRESTWRVAAPPLFFEDSLGASPDPAQCLDEGSVVALELPATADDGSGSTVVLHAQRVMGSGGDERAVAMNDVTPWFGAPDTQQSLRVWLPYEENRDLPAGHYSGRGDLSILGSLDGTAFSSTGLAVDFTVHEATEVDLSDEYTSPGVGLPDSSVYYLVEDPAMGPSTSLWWGGDGPTVLRVPVADEDSGEVVTLVLDSWKEACGSRWELNSGQASDWGCDHAVVLRVAEAGNEALLDGHNYRSPGSSPLVVRAHRWHQPGAGEVLQTLAFELVYSVGD
jgi:hypothetical protein